MNMNLNEMYPVKDGVDYIYFILGVGCDLVKIGYTYNIPARFSQLQASSPVKLALVHAFEAHYTCEKMLHNLLEDHRSHGAWFHLTDEVMNMMERVEEGGEKLVNELDEEREQNWRIKMQQELRARVIKNV